VVGESGIGKSRLLEEAAGLASELLVISVACDEYESSTPYHSIRLLMRDLLGIRPGLETTAVQQRLDDRVRDNDPALEDWLPLLGTVLDVPIPDNEHTSGLTDEFRKSRVDRVIVDALHTLLPTPTMLTFDDVQFMDAASLDVLEAIAKRIHDEPWLLLVAARDEGSGPLEGFATATLRPTALSLADSRRLVHAVTDEHPLPTPVIDALAARSGGNPLFLGELAHASGGVDSDDSLPNSVEDLVTTQVDRLAPRDRTVLRYAAVLGMRCETSALRELVAGRAPAPDRATLGRLADFVVPDQVGSLRFRHALIRDVAYQGLPYRTRRVLHEQVATRLESTATGSSPELLSYHFFHAGRFDKAWSYSTYAGRQARAKYANQEAVDLLTRAVEAERRAPTGMVAPQELGVVHEDLGDIWFRIGLSEEAAEAYRKARRELRGDPVSEARVVAKQARVDQRLSKLPQSLRRVTQALRALEPVEGATAHAARSGLAMRYAISRFSQGRVNEAITWGDRAAREAEEAVDRATLAHAYATLHGIYVAAERVSPMPYGEIALQAYTEIGDLYGQADCTNNLAVAALNENRWPEAADRFGAAAEIYRRVGDSQGEGIAIFNRAEVLVRQGHLDRVEALLEEAMWTARSVSDQDLVALVLREMGRVRCRTGDFDDGLERLAQARAIFLDLDEVAEVPAVDVAVCEALMLRGSGHECLEATAPLLAADDLWLQATVRWIRGFAHLALDESSAAETELIAGSTIATELDDPYASALCLLGLSMARGSDPGADERADELLAGLGVVAVPVPGPRSTLRAATVRGT
ncbi:MAG: ATP-binding protein, partial [Nocardioidaceae bacterium]